MPVLTILFGVGLMAIGVGTYVGSAEPSLSSFLLQMILGGLAMALGVGSIVKKEMRMHLMHGAVLLAAILVLMGVVIPVVEFVSHVIGMDQTKRMDMLRALLTVLVSGGYVYAAVKSFRKARAGRKTGTPEPAKQADPEPDSTPEA